MLLRVASVPAHIRDQERPNLSCVADVVSHDSQLYAPPTGRAAELLIENDESNELGWRHASLLDRFCGVAPPLSTLPSNHERVIGNGGSRTLVVL